MIPGPPSEHEAYAAEMGVARERFAYGATCNVCAHTGYRGRTGIYEILVMSDTLRQFFLDNESRQRLWEQALEDGITPLRRDAMQKVDEGITTPYEVMRVLFSLE